MSGNEGKACKRLAGRKVVYLDVSFRVQVQSPKVHHWQWYGYLSQDYLGTSASLVRASSETRIGETGLICILPGFKVFKLPRFFEGELVWTPGGPKRKGRPTIAKEVS